MVGPGNASFLTSACFAAREGGGWVAGSSENHARAIVLNVDYIRSRNGDFGPRRTPRIQRGVGSGNADKSNSLISPVQCKSHAVVALPHVVARFRKTCTVVVQAPTRNANIGKGARGSVTLAHKKRHMSHVTCHMPHVTCHTPCRAALNAPFFHCDLHVVLTLGTRSASQPRPNQHRRAHHLQLHPPLKHQNRLCTAAQMCHKPPPPEP